MADKTSTRVTVGMNIATCAMLLLSDLSPVLRAMLSVPNLALENAMACRVFRKLKLGLMREHPALSSTASIHPPHPPTISRIRFGLPTSQGLSGHDRGDGIELDSGVTPFQRAHLKEREGTGAQMAVNITQEIEIESESFGSLKRPSEDIV